MKVIDIQIYREKKLKKDLEKKIGEITISPTTGSVIKLKSYFTEWLKMK